MIRERLDALIGKKTADPINRYIKTVEGARCPSHSEPALSHPYSRSIVKLRDNGSIDIFTGTHQGIRIDEGAQAINLVANNLLHHVGAYRLWASEDAKMEINRGMHLVNHTTIDIDSRSDITIRTNGKVRILSAKEVEIQTSAAVSIKAKGSIGVHSDKHIGFKAPRYDFY